MLETPSGISLLQSALKASKCPTQHTFPYFSVPSFLVNSWFINISLLQLYISCCFIFSLRYDNTKFQILEQNKTD